MDTYMYILATVATLLLSFLAIPYIRLSWLKKGVFAVGLVWGAGLMYLESVTFGYVKKFGFYNRYIYIATIALIALSIIVHVLKNCQKRNLAVFITFVWLGISFVAETLLFFGIDILELPNLNVYGVLFLALLLYPFFMITALVSSLFEMIFTILFNLPPLYSMSLSYFVYYSILTGLSLCLAIHLYKNFKIVYRSRSDFTTP